MIPGPHPDSMGIGRTGWSAAPAHQPHRPRVPQADERQRPYARRRPDHLVNRRQQERRIAAARRARAGRQPQIRINNEPFKRPAVGRITLPASPPGRQRHRTDAQHHAVLGSRMRRGFPSASATAPGTSICRGRPTKRDQRGAPWSKSRWRDLARAYRSRHPVCQIPGCPNPSEARSPRRPRRAFEPVPQRWRIARGLLLASPAAANGRIAAPTTSNVDRVLAQQHADDQRRLAAALADARARPGP